MKMCALAKIGYIMTFT